MKREWKDILLLVSLSAVAILTVFLVLCEKKQKDNFCNCFGPATNSIGDAKPSFKGQVCYDPQKIVKLYEAGYFQDKFAGV
jgi:hypothetical protein